MGEIFVSYASEDRARVVKLVEVLEAEGFSVWWDRRIELGVSYDKVIEDAIDEARCILVIWSSTSIDSDWVRAEAADGLERSLLLPVLFEEVRPPLLFRQQQSCRLTDWPESQHDEIQKLLVRIRQLLSVGQREKSEESKTTNITILQADILNETFTDIYSGSIDEALRIGLEDIGAYIYPRDQAVEILNQRTLDVESAMRLGAREGLDFVIGGLVQGTDPRIRIQIEIYPIADPENVIRHMRNVENQNAVVSAVAELTGKTRETLLEHSRSLRFHTEEITAVNLQAFKAYNTAQRLASEERYEEAIPHYQQAVRYDPEMGRAYGGWAVAAESLGKSVIAKEKWRFALKNLDRMGQLERLRTLGAYYGIGSRNYEKAAETFRQLLEISPLEARALNNLAVVTFSLLDFQGALDAGRRALEVFPDSVLYRNNYALYAMYASDFETAKQQAEEVLERNPNYAMVYVPLAITSLVAGDYSQATEIYEAMQKVDLRGASIASMALADLAISTSDTEAAIRIINSGIEEDRRNQNTRLEAAKLLMLAEVNLASGNLDAVHRILAAAESIGLDSARLMTVGHLMVEIGDIDGARRISAALSSKLGRDARAYSHVVEAECLASDHRFGDAVDELYSAFELADIWIGHVRLAEILVRAGHSFEGVEEFNRCVERLGEGSAIYLDDVPTFRFARNVRELRNSTLNAI